MLCPNCLLPFNHKVKYHSKYCAKCGSEYLEQFTTINDVFFSKASLPFYGVIIFFALLSSNPNILWLFPVKIAIWSIFSFKGLRKHYGKCCHKIPGGRSNGKCEKCNSEFLQRKKCEEERRRISDIPGESYRLRMSEIKKIKAARNQKIDVLRSLDPFEFERAVIEMYRHLNYDVKQTPLTNDKGMDGIAYKDGEKYLIECKRYSKDHSVGRPEMQKFFAAISIEKAKGGFFVTTSKFTDTAFEFAKASHRTKKIYIELINGVKLIELMKIAYPDKEKNSVQVMCKKCGAIVLFELNEISVERLLCPNGHEVEKNLYLHKGHIFDKESFQYQQVKEMIEKIQAAESNKS